MEELDLKELLQLFCEKIVQIILIIAVFVVIGIVYTIGFVTPKYRSSTSLILATNNSANVTGQNGITTNDLTLNSKLVSTYSTLAKSKKVVRAVLSNLGLDGNLEDSVRKNISVSTVSDAEFLEITVTNEDPVWAQKIANEVAKVFIQNVQEYYKLDNVHVVDEAEVDNNPYNVNIMKNIVIFAGIGVVVAVLYVLLLNMLDTTIKSAEDIEKVAGVTVLASIPIYDMADDDKKKKRGGRRK